jgi:hypothetical protein
MGRLDIRWGFSHGAQQSFAVERLSKQRARTSL